MWFNSWLRNKTRSSLPSRGRTKPHFRPCLEGLETRQLLSTFTVVLPTDNFPSSGGEAVSDTSGDLRYCIALANAAPAGDADTINFDPTLFAAPQTIALGATLTLSDSNPLTIQGPTGNTATLSGGDAIQVLDVASGVVSISDLTISHGNASGTGALGDGGGILNSGDLTLTGCILDHDVAARFGGGISNSGALTLTNCTLDHDVAASSGGGLVNLAGSATLNGCVLTHDSAIDGGGIIAVADLTLKGCEFSNDSASGVGGGGLWIDGCCNAMVKDTTFSNDTTDEDGGGVFIVTPAPPATFVNCTFSNDFALNGGGGLCTDGAVTVNMTGCNISNDTAAIGGGVCNVGSTVALTQCTLSDDSAFPGTGGGGGLSSSGTSTVTACTFSNDSAPFGGGMDNAGQATLTNCTFSSNRTTLNPSFGGGGIYNSPYAGVPSTISLTNCTLANNSAGPGFGGGIWNAAGCTLHLTNTIVAQNTAASGPDVLGSINTADHNLIGEGGGSTILTDLGGNLIGGNGNPVIDPRLGPLQDNGGHTQTLALYADSPTIGHGDNAKAPATDQRGHKRIDQVGEVTDIGAYEYP